VQAIEIAGEEFFAKILGRDFIPFLVSICQEMEGRRRLASLPHMPSFSALCRDSAAWRENGAAAWRWEPEAIDGMSGGRSSAQGRG
jgi:hypothetical protein